MARTRIFWKEEDVPTGLPISDTILVYEKLDKNDSRYFKKFTEKSFRNTNFDGTYAYQYALGMMAMMEQIETLKREAVEARIRERIYMQRLIVAGLPTAFSPDEIRKFESTMNAMIVQKVDELLDGDLSEIDTHILARVHAMIADANVEYSESPDYQIVMFSNVLKGLECQLSELNRTQMSKKDKAANTAKLVTASIKASERLEYLIDKYKKKNGTVESGNIQSESTQGDIMGGFNLSDFVPNKE